MHYLRFLCLAVLIGVPLATAQVQFSSSNLPVIVINTYGITIPDEPKITAEMGIIDNGPGTRNSLTDPFNDYDGFIGIEARGSSSQMFPKKQYAVETRDSAGNDTDASLLGMPAESDWVLIAAYNDKSLLRDALMFGLVASTGRYASRTRFCEVILNGEYQGVYVLAEKIKRNKQRVNIAKITEADTTGDALTGGYIIKADKVEGAQTAGWFSSFPPFYGAPYRVYYQFHYPTPENITPQQAAYIKQYIWELERTLISVDFADTAVGYPHLFDVDSFVDFFLFSELSKNVDSYRLSAFMYKDKDSKGGRLVMGPMWDYTLAFGNCDFYDASVVPGLQLTYLTSNTSFLYNDMYPVPFWWKSLSNDVKFQEKLRTRWHELRQDKLSLDAIYARIDSLVALLSEGVPRNFDKWRILGVRVWGNVYVGNTYEEEIAYLKQWIAGRVAWLDGYFAVVSVDPPAGDPLTVSQFRLDQNYPNPFNPKTVVSCSVPPSAGRDLVSNGVRDGQWTVDSKVRLVVYDLLGREVAVLAEGRYPAGRYSFTFDGSGLASGIYFYRLTAGAFTDVRKMALVR